MSRVYNASVYAAIQLVGQESCIGNGCMRSNLVVGAFDFSAGDLGKDRGGSACLIALCYPVVPCVLSMISNSLS